MGYGSNNGCIKAQTNPYLPLLPKPSYILKKWLPNGNHVKLKTSQKINIVLTYS
jgi:hypothetical protein